MYVQPSVSVEAGQLFWVMDPEASTVVLSVSSVLNHWWCSDKKYTYQIDFSVHVGMEFWICSTVFYLELASFVSSHSLSSQLSLLSIFFLHASTTSSLLPSPSYCRFFLGKVVSFHFLLFNFPSLPDTQSAVTCTSDSLFDFHIHR